MTWYRITTAGRTYVRDPELHFVRGDDGRFLTAAELLQRWREVGDVEALPASADPEQVMRDAHRPAAPLWGGNVGFGGTR